MNCGYVHLALLLWLAGVAGAGAVPFKRQTISVASDQGWWVRSHLTDVDDDGLRDLLVLLPAQHELRIYRQRPSGFAAAPDQTVALPDQTAWIAMRDVDPHAGKELALSTATGLVCFRQNEGVFELSPQAFIEARQVFAADRLHIVADLPGGPNIHDALPVFLEDCAVLYRRDSDYAWHATDTVSLSPTETTLQAREEYWMAGPNPPFSLEIHQTLRARPQDGQAQQEDNEKKAAQEQIEKIVKDARWRRHTVCYQDVNGDGREDVVLWHTQGDISPASTIVLLLRGQDGRLPERPTRVLRHSGLPIRVNRGLGVSPFWDLDGDGRCELILVALKTRVTAWSGLVNMVVSGGLDWSLTVRSGRDGTYSGGPDFRTNVTSMPPRNVSFSSLFTLDGDFNGDGRTDILVERGPEQFDVYLSSPGGGFSRTGPALSFAAPIEARRISTADLNGDGISDLFVQKLTEAQLTVYLSQSDPQKGTSR